MSTTAPIAAPVFLSKKEAAAMLGVSKSTIERLEAEGRFVRGFLITPKRRVYRLTDVQKYIEDRENAPTTRAA